MRGPQIVKKAQLGFFDNLKGAPRSAARPDPIFLCAVPFSYSPNTGGIFCLWPLRAWYRSMTAFSASVTRPPARNRSMAA